MTSQSTTMHAMHIQKLMNMLNRAVKQHCRHLQMHEDVTNDIQQINYLTALIDYSL